MDKKLTGKNIRQLSRDEKKIITFYLTIDEALEFNYIVKCKKVTSQDYLRNLILKELKKN